MRTKHEKISFWAFLIVIAISSLALAGWLADVLALAGMGKNFVPMAPGTILCFILTGIASLNLLQKNKQAVLFKIILFCALVFNFLVMIDILSGYPIEIEQIFGTSHGFLNNFPIGRMSPATCVLFLISIASLLFITNKTTKSHKLSIFLCAAGICAALTFDLGYLYGTPLLYGKSIIPPALNTSIAFTFLFIGILFGFGMNEMPLKLFVGESVRARLMRGFLPVTLLIIVIAGWFETIIFQFYNDQVLATALVTILSLLVLGIILLKMAKKIGNDIDRIFSFRKETEEKLISERKLLRTLIDNLPIAIYIKDTECRKIITNRTDLEIIGAKSEEEVLGKTDLETYSSEIGKRGYAEDKKVIETGVPFINHEEDFYDIAGVHRWLLTSKIPLTDENGKITGLVGTGRDVTEQKKVEEKLIGERRLLRTLIDNLPVTIYVKDAECRKIIANRADLEVIGAKSEEEVLGKTDLDTFDNEIGQRGFADDKKVIDTGEAVLNREEDFYDNKGIQRWLLTSKIPLTDENGKIIGLVGIGRDITEQKKIQGELIDAKEKAEESDRLKSSFLANMSHEIRTPLNSIIGFSELLSDPFFEQQQKDEFINTIIDNGNNLLIIISDIMDFSMLESGQMKIRREVIPVKKLLSDLVADFSKKATRKGIEIRIDQSLNNLDVMIESDPYRIKQIFNNLIGNALKFTHEGYIEIGYKIQDKKIEFHVKDTGIGIVPEYHQTIF